MPVAELQDRYFNRRTIDSEEYYQLLNQYTTELRKIESTIDSFKAKKKKEEKEIVKEKVKEKPAFLFKVGKEKEEVKEGKKKEEAKEGQEKGQKEFIGGIFKIKKKEKIKEGESEEK